MVHSCTYMYMSTRQHLLLVPTCTCKSIDALHYRSEEESDESGEDEDDGDTESDRQEVPELIPVPSREESHGHSRLSRPDGPAGGSADVSEEEEEEGEGEGESDREELELVEVDVKPPEQWDCESILRYSI